MSNDIKTTHKQGPWKPMPWQDPTKPPVGHPDNPRWGKRTRSRQRRIAKAKDLIKSLTLSACFSSDECELVMAMTLNERTAWLKNRAERLQLKASRAKDAHAACMGMIQRRLR